MVLGFNQFRDQQVARLRKLADVASAAFPAFAASGLAGGLLLLLLPLFAVQLDDYAWLVSAIAAISLVALLLPYLEHWLRREAVILEGENSAEKSLVALQADLTNASIFFKLKSDGFEPLPNAVIITERACILINYIQLHGTHQNNGASWMRRNDEGEWQRIRENPTRAIQAASVSFCEQFNISADAICMGLLWCGEGIVLHEKAEADIFLLNQPEPFAEWIAEQESLEPEQSQQLIKQLRSTYRSQKSKNNELTYA